MIVFRGHWGKTIMLAAAQVLLLPRVSMFFRVQTLQYLQMVVMLLMVTPHMCCLANRGYMPINLTWFQDSQLRLCILFASLCELLK
jgi:hypothetical protein